MPEITHFPAERALSDGYSSVCHRGGEGLDWARLDTAIRPELLECLRCLPPLLPPSFFFFFFAPVCWWRHSHIWRVSVTGLWQMTDSLKLSWWSPRPLIVLRAVFDLRVMTWSQGLFCFSAQFNPRRPPPPPPLRDAQLASCWRHPPVTSLLHSNSQTLWEKSVAECVVQLSRAAAFLGKVKLNAGIAAAQMPLCLENQKKKLNSLTLLFQMISHNPPPHSWDICWSDVEIPWQTSVKLYENLFGLSFKEYRKKNVQSFICFERPHSPDTSTHTFLLVSGQTRTLEAGVVFFGRKSLLLLPQSGRQG